MTTMTDTEIEKDVESIFRELGADGCPVNSHAMIVALNRRMENPRLQGMPHIVLMAIASFANEHGEAQCSYNQIARRATIIMHMFSLVSEVGPSRIKQVLSVESA